MHGPPKPVNLIPSQHARISGLTCEDVLNRNCFGESCVRDGGPFQVVLMAAIYLCAVLMGVVSRAADSAPQTRLHRYSGDHAMIASHGSWLQPTQWLMHAASTSTSLLLVWRVHIKNRMIPSLCRIYRLSKLLYTTKELHPL